MKILHSALIGSHNYNLNVPDSDYDFKNIVMPDRKTLFSGQKVSYVKRTEEYDLAVHDIRDMITLLYKSNINFIETLFSISMESVPEFVFFIRERENIASVNLPYLYKGCMGMIKNKEKRLYNEDGSLHLKNAMSILRIQDFLQRYESTGFTSFEKAFRYDEGEDRRKQLLRLRQGEESIFHKEQDFMREEADKLGQIYLGQAVNNDLLQEIGKVSEDIFWKNINHLIQEP